MINNLYFYRDDLLSQRSLIEDKVKSLPDMPLWTSTNKGKFKYYTIENNKKVVIKKSNISYARKLAKNKFYKYKLNDLQKEIEFLNSYLEKEDLFHSADKYLNKSDAIKELLSHKDKIITGNTVLDDWSNEEYQKNPYHKDSLTVQTSTGEFVRSKSEALIVEALINSSVPYRYECLFECFGNEIYPDFTIIHPKTGRKYIWEHFGFMDDASYRNNAIRKLSMYSNCGYVLGDNLIISTEVKNKPFSYHKAQEIINEYLK